MTRFLAVFVLQSSTDAAAVLSETEEAPPGTDSTPDFAEAALPQRGSGIAETSYAHPAVFWQPSAYHAAPSYASGWYYQDVSKVTQGPFTKQQLQLWRQHLPMDLLVWFIDQNGGSSHSLELAKVLGDGRLLESWRRAQQATVCPCLHISFCNFLRDGQKCVWSAMARALLLTQSCTMLSCTCDKHFVQTGTMQFCFCSFSLFLLLQDSMCGLYRISSRVQHLLQQHMSSRCQRLRQAPPPGPMLPWQVFHLMMRLCRWQSLRQLLAVP